MKTHPWVIRLVNIEYWPSWIFYIPVWIQHIWLTIKTKNAFFFLATNPAIKGFILSDSKFKTLKLVPEPFKPKTLFVPVEAETNEVLKNMKNEHIEFPIILKPDIGFRGIKVSKIENMLSLADALDSLKVDSIIQEYITGALELGVFYYRYPNQPKGHIPSVTVKSMLKISGDGRHTLKELVMQYPRAVLQKDRLAMKFNSVWNSIVPKGEVMVLEEIGNHSRGTQFINGNNLVDGALLSVFDELSHQMDGFYFGRFDIKVPSLDALKQGKQYSILEVNGVGGEPTHIYEPNTGLLSVWKDLCFTWRVAAEIAMINFERGVRKPTYSKAKEEWKLYVNYKRKLYS